MIKTQYICDLCGATCDEPNVAVSTGWRRLIWRNQGSNRYLDFVCLSADKATNTIYCGACITALRPAFYASPSQGGLK